MYKRQVHGDDPRGGRGVGHHPDPAPVGRVGDAPRVSGAFEAVEHPGDGSGGEVQQSGEVTGGERGVPGAQDVAQAGQIGDVEPEQLRHLLLADDAQGDVLVHARNRLAGRGRGAGLALHPNTP